VQSILIGNMPIKKREIDEVSKQESVFVVKQNEGFVKIENVIKGKLQYLRMVRGENSSMYHSLNKRFSIYLQKNQPGQLPQSDVYKSIRASKDTPKTSVYYAEILDNIFEKGLDEALDKINL
jgi:hypothetical protein